MYFWQIEHNNNNSFCNPLDIYPFRSSFFKANTLYFLHCITGYFILLQNKMMTCNCACKTTFLHNESQVRLTLSWTEIGKPHWSPVSWRNGLYQSRFIAETGIYTCLVPLTADSIGSISILHSFILMDTGWESYHIPTPKIILTIWWQGAVLHK